VEYVQGTDLRVLVPHEIAGTVCSVHKEAIIVHALTVLLDVYALALTRKTYNLRI
jgi:hypothetical protein